jgi:DNA-directed RNA polymerase II subunit RPB2
MDIQSFSKKWETELWSIIDSYFKNTDNYLCKNQLDSYNRFLEVNIPKTIRQFNPIVLSYNKIEHADKSVDEYKYEVNIMIGASIKYNKGNSNQNSIKYILIDDDVNENNQVYTKFDIYDSISIINDAKNIVIGKPIIQEVIRSNDGITVNQKPLYPNEARLKNITYLTEIQTDIIVEYKVLTEKSQPIVIRRFKNISLGRVPIMVQSKICSLFGMKYDTLSLMGECKYDHGGYFIIDGKEKVIIAQERQIENKIYVNEIKDPNSKFSMEAEVRSAPENKFQPARITNLLLCSRSDKPSILKIKSKDDMSLIDKEETRSNIYLRKDAIYVEIPEIGSRKPNGDFVATPIPLFIVFRALGIISDEEILKIILGDFDSNFSRTSMEFLQTTIKNNYIKGTPVWRSLPPSITNVLDGNITTQYDAIMFLSGLINPKFLNPDIEYPEIRKAIIDLIIKDYFLPHVGSLYIHKAHYLGYMTKMLLETMYHRRFTDRDSYMYKRVDLAGFLISTIFRDLYFRVKNRLKEICNIEYDKKDIDNYWDNIDTDRLFWPEILKDFKKYNIYRLIGSNAFDDTAGIISVNKILDQMIINDGFIFAFKNEWGLKNATGNKEGVVQDLARLSYVGFVSHLRRINTPLSSSSKVRPPHSLHPSSWGIMCPSETPDGGNIGLRKNLAIFAVISAGTNSMNLLRCLYTNGMESIEQVDYDSYKYTKIFLNERIVGYTRDPLKFYRSMKLLKCNAIINIYTSITFNSLNNYIKINTDSGRGIRPVLKVNSNNQLEIFKPLSNGKTVIQSLIDNDINWNHLIGGFRNIDKVKPFDDQDEKYYIDEHLQYTNNELDELQGVIEYIDKDEEDTGLVALTIHDILMNEYKYDYCEIHPSLILGLLANCIPLIEMNQGPRHLYAVGQSKQALGLYASNFRNRMDTKGQIMYYPQKSIVKNKLERYLFTNDLPNGINAIVAIGCFTGYNQEDSIIFNKASVERGLFRTVKYRTYSARDEVENRRIVEKIMYPDPKYTKELKSGNYSKLNDDGIIKEGIKISENDILIGKCVVTTEKDSEGNQIYADNSEFVRRNEDGFVDKVYSNLGNDEQRYVKVRIRKDKKPELGDKFCSRFGQKGTIGMLLSPYDLPFSKRGIQPDLIVNAHAFPSRMTIAQFLEVVLGKDCIEKGLFSEVASFSEVNKEVIGDVLESVGFERYGNEVLYNGMTGEMMHVNYFIGPTYYQRLTHQVSDKYQSRDDGLKTALTHQPVGGRSLGGGGRIGEMERDALLSHGAMGFLQESFMERSDKDSIIISQSSGKISVYNSEKGIYKDFMRDEITQWFDPQSSEVVKKTTDPTMYIPKFSRIEIPYSFKLFMQEVEAMGISMKLETESNYLNWNNDLICPSDKSLMDIVSIESTTFKTDMIKDEKYWIMIKELIESNLTSDNKSYADIIINDIKNRSYLSISTHKNIFNNKFIKKTVIEYNKSRSIKRVNDVIELLPKSASIKSFIDIGADDGSITKALAEYFNVPKYEAYGLNVVDSPFITEETLEKVSMIKYVSRNNTGLPDESVDLVMMNEVLHHVHEIDRTHLLKEIYRILKPGGYIFLREHDLSEDNTIEFIQFLQLVHGAYIMIRDEDYNDYYSEYFNFEYLRSLMKNLKFRFINKTEVDTKKLQRVYTTLFQKVESTELIESNDITIKNIKNFYELKIDIATDMINVIQTNKPEKSYDTEIKEKGLFYIFQYKWNNSNIKFPKIKLIDTNSDNVDEDSLSISYLVNFYPIKNKYIDLDPTKFIIVPSSFKSSSDHKTAMKMANDIINDIQKNTDYKLNDINKFSITDGTSNIGANSFPFMLYFKHVHCIEYDKETVNALNNNLSLLLNRCHELKNKKFKNDNEYANIKCMYLSIRHGDFSLLYNEYNTNIVFLDVPWTGGDRYMDFDRANYKLGEILLKDLVIKIFNENSLTSVIALKLPIDYDENEFNNNIYSSTVYTYNKYKMFVLIKKLSNKGGSMGDSDMEGLAEQIQVLDENPTAFTSDKIEVIEDKLEDDENNKKADNIINNYVKEIKNTSTNTTASIEPTKSNNTNNTNMSNNMSISNNTNKTNVSNNTSISNNTNKSNETKTSNIKKINIDYSKSINYDMNDKNYDNNDDDIDGGDYMDENREDEMGDDNEFEIMSRKED